MTTSKKVASQMLLFGVCLLLTTAAVGQGMNVAESAKQQGDPIRYTLTLEAPVKGVVNVIYLSFNLKTPERPDQKGLPVSFDLHKFKPISPTVYQIDDNIPEVMSGTYQLESIKLRTQEGGARGYSYPGDFKQDITIKVETDKKDVFPNIKSVEPSH
jgi:hypothetical protein